jgi:hypothetical protein
MARIEEAGEDTDADLPIANPLGDPEQLQRET